MLVYGNGRELLSDPSNEELPDAIQDEKPS